VEEESEGVCRHSTCKVKKPKLSVINKQQKKEKVKVKLKTKVIK
jgi:hypothetical protein